MLALCTSNGSITPHLKTSALLDIITQYTQHASPEDFSLSLCLDTCGKTPRETGEGGGFAVLPEKPQRMQRPPAAVPKDPLTPHHF